MTCGRPVSSSATFPDNGLVEHWDGHSWSVIPLPAATTASVMLDSIAATAADQV